MNLLTEKLRQSLHLFAATCFLFLLPFIGMMPHATATSMPISDPHSMHDQTDIDMDCAAACARAASAPPTQVIINENEIRTPDPEPCEFVSYHVQFASVYAPKVLRPEAMYLSSPARPPDIVKSTGHFLL